MAALAGSTATQSRAPLRTEGGTVRTTESKHVVVRSGFRSTWRSEVAVGEPRSLGSFATGRSQAPIWDLERDWRSVRGPLHFQIFEI